MALLLWLALAPAEARLGNLIKLIYLHGALVWVGMGTFAAAGLLGLVALVVRRRAWYHGSQAASLAALALWAAYSVSAVVVTGLAWGQWIAWGEPRVRATGLILVAAAILAVVTWLVRHADLSAVVNILLGIAAWIAVLRAEVIRHPEDPIGASESGVMQTYYLLIVLTVAALASLFVYWLWLRLQARSTRLSSHSGSGADVS